MGLPPYHPECAQSCQKRLWCIFRPYLTEAPVLRPYGRCSVWNTSGGWSGHPSSLSSLNKILSFTLSVSRVETHCILGYSPYLGHSFGIVRFNPDRCSQSLRICYPALLTRAAGGIWGIPILPRWRHRVRRGSHALSGESGFCTPLSLRNPWLDMAHQDLF
jgi:hypothetical protein